MTDLTLDTKLKQLISDEQAYMHRIIPVESSSDSITFLTDHVSSEKIQELNILFGKEISLKEEDNQSIDNLLSYNFRKKTNSTQLNYSEDFILKILYNAKYVS